jgi:predicted O-methyltransferase YrrM
MNITKFVDWLNMGSYERPSKQVRSICEDVNGFSSPRLVEILNMAVHCLGKDELYLEIGTFLGRAIIGALVDNSTKNAVGVDNFSQYDTGNNEVEFLVNLAKYGVSKRVEFHKEDCQFFLRKHTEYTGKVGVYFYDGDHTNNNVFLGVVHVLPLLAEHAIIVLDDASRKGMWEAEARIIEQYSDNLNILFTMGTAHFPYPGERWRNGVMVFEWRRNGNI